MNTAHKQRHSIAPSQIKAIHAAVNSLGMDDDDYRAMLRERYKVQSCKDLTLHQAEDLLDDLNRKAGRPAAAKPGSKYSKKYSDMDNRPGFASGAQLRLIDAMWAQVSFAEDAEKRERGLNAFCLRIAKVAGLRMLRGYQVERIVKALEAMGAEHKYKMGGTS